MITSVHNPRVQAVRKLQAQAKERREGQSCVVEGVRLAEEVLQANWKVTQVFFTNQLDERGRAVVERFVGRGVPVEEVNDRVMSSVSETETPQGLLAVVSQQTLPLPPALDFMLILDRLRDPGNLGTILRTALAAGVQGVLLAPGCVDAWSGKVLRAGMGAHFRLPIHSLCWPDIRDISREPTPGLKVFLADSAGGIAYTQADLRAPIALIVGGEAAGAGYEAQALADDRVHIPMPGGSESLNAAIATSILLFEVVRQRTANIKPD
jgi:TrmH family RNA methyltransferase